jgi:hypothetical protein
MFAREHTLSQATKMLQFAAELRLLHDEIRVRIRKDDGTVFRIFLPLDTTAGCVNRHP